MQRAARPHHDKQWGLPVPGGRATSSPAPKGLMMAAKSSTEKVPWYMMRWTGESTVTVSLDSTPNGLCDITTYEYTVSGAWGCRISRVTSIVERCMRIVLSHADSSRITRMQHAFGSKCVCISWFIAMVKRKAGEHDRAFHLASLGRASYASKSAIAGLLADIEKYGMPETYDRSAQYRARK